MSIDDIRKKLYEQQDTRYRDFQVKLIPGADPASFIGVRTPALRQMAKELPAEDAAEFLSDLPHRYFDENQLHAFIISAMRDFDACMAETERFLPYVDNWATCDQMSPKVFKKHKKELLVHIDRWIASEKTYTVRFGIGMLMEHYLDEEFDTSYPEKVAHVRSDEYYVMMMKAWYFATALAKQYDAVIPFIEEGRLDQRTHNKAIQKALESYRISPEKKEYLKKLKVKA
jgi:3-methyladenine DNA glycosylase AlkD